jgi:asparagine synthase (glutamine-hydrolysing)
MCGIAGILTFNGAPVRADEILALNEALAHRGRDSAAYRLGGAENGDLSAYSGIALGHRRLSIIDLSPQSAQPMRSQNSTASIVYNGELYNYLELRAELISTGFRFRTNSDTEVILAAYEAWGEECLHRFNGMFAFAIWDEASQSLFCARDPVGIKPFYYTLSDERFAFASESQALVENRSRLLDSQALACYFMSMYVPRHLSIFAGVSKLLPGHSMRVSREGRVSTRKFWNMPEGGTRHAATGDAVAELTEILDRAVKAQLRSDVPVGALLSGGFDSGMIVASASRAGVPLHTYSVGFDDGVQASELPIARDMAARYGTTHHERVIRGSEIIGFLDSAIGRMSEPVADSAIVPTYCLSGMAADDGVKVLLSGAGGDEVFAGYSRYVASSLQRKILFLLPPALRTTLGRTLFANTLLGARLRHPALDMLVYAGGSPSLARYFFKNDSGFRQFLEELAGHVFPALDYEQQPLYKHMSFDLQVYLPDLLLMTLDQLTMAHTVEGRVPLLDIDLIKASYNLDSSLHASPTQPTTRRLMRAMAAGRVDPRTFTSRKLGFSGPVRYWVSHNSAIFKEVAMAAREIPELRGWPIEALWQSGEIHQSPAWAKDIFSLYCFSRWYHDRG